MVPTYDQLMWLADHQVLVEKNAEHQQELQDGPSAGHLLALGGEVCSWENVIHQEVENMMHVERERT